MNAKIICQNLSKEKIEKAFVLGEYQKDDFGVQSVKYKMYGRGDSILIEFETEFDFCQLIFLIVDLLEISRNDKRNIKGFVNTKKSNKITEYLNEERVCLYLSEELKQALKEEQDKYLDMVDIVTKSNNNYSIDIDSFFSYTSEDQTKFEESDLKIFDYELIKEDEYLYELSNFEEEYLEDLKKENGS